MEVTQENLHIMKAYIDEHFCDPNLTVAELTTHFGGGYEDVSRAFKSKFGVTTAAYIKERRLQKSIEMMKESPLTLEEIGYACGYYDARTFYGAFKKHFGAAPREYVKGLAGSVT